MKKLLMLLPVLTPLFAALAETYYSEASGSSGAYTRCWLWKTSSGATASVSSAANDGNAWVLMGASKLTSAAKLPNTTWYMGSDGTVLPKKGIPMRQPRSRRFSGISPSG